MKFFQHLLLLFVLIAFSEVTFAQQLKENELVVIKGEKFVLHQVRTGETIYSITRKFGTDSLTLVQNNPIIASGLKIGQILKIPYRENADLAEQPVYKKGDPSHFVFHTIESRTETPYFIAKEYGVTVEEIYAYNPEIRRYRRGTKVRIPRWDVPADKISENRKPDNSQNRQPQNADEDELMSHKVVKGETLYSIAKKYNVSESEILFFNPGAKNLKTGDMIYLPAKKEPAKAQPEVTANTGESSGNYFEHIIVSGETMWGISRKYNVPEEELINLNPVLKSGFQTGVVIKIPVKKEETVEAKPVNKDAFITHTVQQGETLYGLAARYGLKVPDIKKYNPFLENQNLVVGKKILIPRKPDEEIVEFMKEKTDDSTQVILPDYYEIEVPRIVPEGCKPAPNNFYSTEVYDVALFLPLFVEANDTLNKKPKELEMFADSLMAEEVITESDTLIEEDEPEDMFFGFYRNSENYIQFYEGVLLAVDSMQRAGMNIRLHVFDTEHSASAIRKYIYNPDFLETDLIIGPVYQEVQKEVAEIAAKNRIPIVSPLSSQSADVNSNPYFYQVNPDRDYIAAQTAQMIAEEYFNSNFIVFKTSEYGGTPEGKLVNLIQEKLYNSGFLGKPNGANFTIYDFKNEGPFGFRRILSHQKENVVYIPTSVVGELSVAISNINNLADDYSITLIGSNRYQQYESIDMEHFHNLKLEFIAPYWIDYQKEATINFVEKFRGNFYTEPDNFGVQGYDVAFYFLNALNSYGKDFNECLPYLQTNLIQGNYQFAKVSQFGGYMNEGVSVISYERDYDVVKERVIGQFKFAQK